MQNQDGRSEGPYADEIESDLQLLAFSITEKCNHNCAFCSRSALTAKNAVYLTSKKIIETVEEVMTFSQPGLIPVSGGEPMLHPEWVEILYSLSRFEVPVKLNTTATLVTPQKASLIRKAGVKEAIVSLDGPTEEIHDDVRDTKGSFRRCLRGLKYLEEAGVPFSINFGITPRNQDSAIETMHFASSIGATAINMSRIYPTGRACQHMAKLSVSWETFVNIALTCIKEKPKHMRLYIEDDVQRHFFDPRYQLKFDYYMEHPEALDGKCMGCFAGIRMLHINPDGEVLSCSFLEKSVGNIHETSIRDIWFDSPFLKQLRNRSSHLTGACGGCEAKSICGGCRGRAYGIHGDPFAEDPFCKKSNELIMLQ